MVNEQEVVPVKAVGKPGFLMYEQLRLIVEPHVSVMKTQHTPKLEWIM